ncbi:MAG: hypothetical protein ACXWLM_05750 [Myxococcales bacterium]
MADRCAHLEALLDPHLKPVTPSGHGCKECLASGGWWVNPTMKSFEPCEDWAFCYLDDVGLDGFPGLRGESTSVHYASPNDPG